MEQKEAKARFRDIKDAFEKDYLEFSDQKARNPMSVVVEKVARTGIHGGTSYRIWNGEDYERRPDGSKYKIISMNERQRRAMECGALTGMLTNFDGYPQ